MDKHQAVLNHLQNNVGITSMEAFNLYGATRLSSIIFDLRKKYDIENVWREEIDRYGNKCRYVEYRLRK